MAGNHDNAPENVLTGIHSAYTVSATPESETSEVDKIMINNFLYTLAEVSLCIASRKHSGEVEE
ncbi:hypothetical protein ACFLTB_04455 [Chloroflexota bacterium]